MKWSTHITHGPKIKEPEWIWERSKFDACLWASISKGIQASFNIKHYFELEGFYNMKDQFILDQNFELRMALVVGLELEFLEAA